MNIVKTTSITSYNFGQAIQELQEHLENGWSVDYSNNGYPTDYINYYVINLVMYEDEQEENKEVETTPVKKAGRQTKVVKE